MKYLTTIKEITQEAQDAFWDVIAKNNPHITTGDLDPYIVYGLTDLMEAAVKSWIELNTPEIDLMAAKTPNQINEGGE